MKKLTLVLMCLLVSAWSAFAQTTVTGTVISAEDGEPVLGASVVIKGTTQGTVTDLDGKFTLSVQPGMTLQISYIGFETAEVAAKQNMKVTLTSSMQNLDEVMVVAYGTAKRSAFTGSAGVVKGESIATRQVSNVTNALKGQIAGVQVTSNNGQPGSTATVRIRGVGSLAASNAPLYVIDGVPYDGDLSAINTADIESTTVLKDAASNALYGARGANGVILITTKKGSSKEAVISFEGRWGVNSRAVPNYNVMTDPAMYMETAYKSIYNNYMTQSGMTPENAHTKANTALPTNSDGGIGYKIYTVPNGGLLIGQDGKLNQGATLGYLHNNRIYKPDDWYKELFKTDNLRQEYNLSVSGGNDKLNYYVSGGYLDDTGIMPSSGFKRFTTRTKVDYQAKKWLKIGGNVNYSYYDMTSPSEQDGSSSSVNMFYVANNIAPIYPLYMRDKDGNVMIDSNGFTVYDFGDGTGGTFKRTWMSGSNPASVQALDKRKYISDVISGRWYAAIDLYEGLKFTYNVGFDSDNQRYTRLYNAYYGQYSKVGGVVYAGSTREMSLNQQQLLTYRKQFGEHDIDLLLGHESYDYSYKYVRASKEKLFNPDIAEVDNAILNPSAESYSDYYTTQGWLFRGQYDYAGKYMASVSYRRDGSSRFAANKRWGNFGSLGLAWLANKESFLEDQKWIDMLKVKASYGIQGNDNLLYRDGYVNYYPYQDQYQLKENNKDFATTLLYKGNPNITWETSYTFNGGVDFDFWKGKLSGSVEYFNRTTKDMLYFMPVPVSNGYSFYPKNIGSVRNSGVEFDLHSKVVQTEKVTVGLFANATFLNSKIVTLAPELGGKLIDGNYIYAEGEGRYQMYIQKYAGVAEDGQALYYKDVVDAQGKITGTEKTTNYNTATKYKTGNMMPSVYGGFGINATAYGFDANIAFAYQLGGRVYDNGYANFMHSGYSSSAGQNWHMDILNAWSIENPSSNIPRINSKDNFSNTYSDRFLVSSDYLDLTNVVVGYTLPKSFLNKLQISSLRVFVNADNVFLLTARKGMDPRQSYTSASNARYAPLRTISGGLSIKF